MTTFKMLFTLLSTTILVNCQAWHVPKGTCKCHYDPKYNEVRDYSNFCATGYSPFHKTYEIDEPNQDISITMIACECACLKIRNSARKARHQNNFWLRIG